MRQKLAGPVIIRFEKCKEELSERGLNEKGLMMVLNDAADTKCILVQPVHKC